MLCGVRGAQGWRLFGKGFPPWRGSSVDAIGNKACRNPAWELSGPHRLPEPRLWLHNRGLMPSHGLLPGAQPALCPSVGQKTWPSAGPAPLAALVVPASWARGWQLAEPLARAGSRRWGLEGSVAPLTPAAGQEAHAHHGKGVRRAVARVPMVRSGSQCLRGSASMSPGSPASLGGMGSSQGPGDAVWRAGNHDWGDLNLPQSQGWRFSCRPPSWLIWQQEPSQGPKHKPRRGREQPGLGGWEQPSWP